MNREKYILLCADVLLVVALSVVSAVAWSSWFSVSWNIAWMVFGVSLGILVAFWPFRWAILLVCVLAFSAVGSVWMESRLDLSNTNALSGNAFSGSLHIIGEPQEERYTQRLPARVIASDQENLLNTMLWLRTEQWTSFAVGDVVEVYCDLEIPEKGGDGTDWAKIFAARGPVVFCDDRDAVLSGERVENWRSMLASIRTRAEDRLAESIPYPESALAEGLLFGGTSGLTEAWEEKFAQTSMTHIVAVSGYNVTLLVQYVGILAVAVGFRRQRSWWVSIGVITFFVALIGFPASGVRAGIMGALALVALSGGTASSGVRALVLAAAFMLICNPFLLRYDVGFQLSLLATLGIILGMPLAAKIHYDRWSIVPRMLFEIAATTLFAQAFVLPILLMTFGSFSLVSFVANIMILWTIPFAMLLSMTVLLFGAFSHFVASLMGMAVWGVLSYIFFLIDTLSQSESVLVFENGNTWIFLLYYMVLLGGFVWYALESRIRSKRHCLSYGTRNRK